MFSEKIIELGIMLPQKKGFPYTFILYRKGAKFN